MNRDKQGDHIFKTMPFVWHDIYYGKQIVIQRSIYQSNFENSHGNPIWLLIGGVARDYLLNFNCLVPIMLSRIFKQIYLSSELGTRSRQAVPFKLQSASRGAVVIIKIPRFKKTAMTNSSENISTSQIALYGRRIPDPFVS